MRCLGKHPPRHDPRTLRLARYLDIAALPPAPPARDWGDKLAAIGEMANDRAGDCTCAAFGHLVQTWTSQLAGEVTVSDADVLAAYSAITGYTPADPSTDTGANMLDVLAYLRATGIGGHTIGAFVKLDSSIGQAQLAIDLFGGIYVGAALPLSAQTVGGIWDVQDGPAGVYGSWGGHAIACVAYDRTGVTFLTWGAKQRATWAWYQRYVDEAYALLSADWVTGDAPAPSGFDVLALRADLAAIGSATP